MNCSYHVETPAVAFCRMCGRALCGVCATTVAGTVYCPEHAAVGVYGAPPYGSAPPPFESGRTLYTNYGPTGPAAAGGYAAGGYPVPGAIVPPVRNSPWLAFALGWIPGVGAIYNGQYIKGLVHAVVFGLLVGALDSNPGSAMQPMLGILLAAFIFYQVFEAFHTAKQRQAGIPIDEWSGLVRPRGGQARVPIGPVVLIGLGAMFLLDSLRIISFREVSRFWPVLLIAFGAYLLWARMNPSASEMPYPPHVAQPLGYSPQPEAPATEPVTGVERER